MLRVIAFACGLLAIVGAIRVALVSWRLTRRALKACAIRLGRAIWHWGNR